MSVRRCTALQREVTSVCAGQLATVLLEENLGGLVVGVGGWEWMGDGGCSWGEIGGVSGVGWLEDRGGWCVVGGWSGGWGCVLRWRLEWCGIGGGGGARLVV